MNDIGSLLAQKAYIVLYSPLRTEVPLRSVVTNLTADVYEVPARASIDPRLEAKKIRALTDAKDTAILMPGRKFDEFGTRLGQGGGWYDQFLSEAPVEWLRIGCCFDDQFSTTPLPRQPWDEPVDIVCVLNRTTGTVETIETRARMPAFDTL